MRFRGPLPEEVLPVGRACGAVLPSAACSVAVSVAQAVQVRAPRGAAWALELLKGWWCQGEEQEKGFGVRSVIWIDEERSVPVLSIRVLVSWRVQRSGDGGTTGNRAIVHQPALVSTS